MKKTRSSFWEFKFLNIRRFKNVREQECEDIESEVTNPNRLLSDNNEFAENPTITIENDPPLTGTASNLKKDSKITLRLLILLLLLSTIVILLFPFSEVECIGGIIIFLSVAIILEGLVKIESDPTHIGQLTIFGERITGEFLTEGWHFIPLRGLWYGVIPIKRTRIPYDVTIPTARTPDRAASEVPVHLAFQQIPRLAINYLDSGGEEGVKEQLFGRVTERIREWCMGKEEGPDTWVELDQSQAEGTFVLVKKLAHNFLVPIEPKEAQEVPTWIWMLYFREPKPTKLNNNEEDWGKDNWAKVKEVIDQIKKKYPDNDPTGLNIQLKKLKDSVESRRKQIDALRKGSGKLEITDLGIELQLLNIGNIKVLGKVAEEADNQAKEEQQMRGEKLELEHLRNRIREFLDLGYSLEQARETIQTERDKVVKTIKENIVTISPETLKSFKETLAPSALKILELFIKKGGKE